VSAPSTLLTNVENLLAQGKDGPLLRFALGNEHLKAGDAARAAEHLVRATALDPDYTAAWKLLGRALTEAGRGHDALAAYAKGIEAAVRRGDKQAQKEMQVFVRRLERAQGDA
jgi:predicted Zn-dependent protease